MSLLKKKITEKEAAAQFLSIKLKEHNDFWPTNYATMKDQFGEKFIIQDEGMGTFDLFLAKIALDIQSLKNLFPAEQADRIRRYILKRMNISEYGAYAVDEIQEYEKAYDEGIKLREDPIAAIGSRLLYKWFGANIADFEVEVGGNKTGMISPMLGLCVTMILDEGIGWKVIKDNFRIVEGLP